MAQHPVQRELSDKVLGWLRYMYRKAAIQDDWSKTGQPSEMWEDKS